MHLVLPYTWMFCTLLCFVGWGNAVNRLLWGHACVHWSLRAAWGLALTMLVGGLLNLGGLISAVVLQTYVLAGVAWFVRGRLPDQPGEKQTGPFFARLRDAFTGDKAVSLLWVALALCVLLDLLCWTWYDPNVYDDLQAYVVFAERMVQTGSSGPDPYNMALHLSFGGHSFLLALMLSVETFRYLNLIELGLGLLVVLGLIDCAGKRFGISGRQTVLLMLGVAVLSVPQVNLSATYSALLALLGVALSAGLRPEQGQCFRHSLLMALMLSSLCALKNTLIVPAAVFFGVYFGLEFVLGTDRIRTLRSMLVISFAGVLMLLPWGLAVYHSGGTLLFPVLGIGYYRPAFDPSFPNAFQTPALTESLLASQVSCLLIIVEIVGAAWLVVRPWRNRQNWPALATLAAAFAGSMALALASRWSDVGRYGFSVNLAALLLCLCLAFRRGNEGLPLARTWPVFASMVVLLVANVATYVQSRALNRWPQLNRALLLLGSSAREDARDLDRVQCVTTAQKAVPEGSAILARLSSPFMVDFARNPVFVAYRPGLFSPPPGMPVGQGGEAVADYLLANGVSYVMYSYYDRANFGPDFTMPRIEDTANPVLRADALAAVAFHDEVLEMAQRRKTIYDDGFFLVIDLKERGSGQLPGAIQAGGL